MIHKPIIRFFSSDEMVLMYASRHVVVMLLSQWFYAIFNCIISIVNGTGKVRYTTIVNILMLWAVRIPSAYIISRYFDGTWVMLCFPISFQLWNVCNDRLLSVLTSMEGSYENGGKRNKMKVRRIWRKDYDIVRICYSINHQLQKSEAHKLFAYGKI